MSDKNNLPKTLSLIEENVLKHSNPLRISKKENSLWSDKMNLPVSGDILFYTGGEYQFLPFIDSLVSVMDYISPTSRTFDWLMNMRSIVSKLGFSPEKVFASVFASDKDRYFDINRKAAEILLSLGYDIFYDGSKEIYSGALLHELGFSDALNLYEEQIINFIVNSKAKSIVCLSPHAAEMFKYVYSKNADFPNLKISTFTELVHHKKNLLPFFDNHEDVVIHDSCRMAREMGIINEIRGILDSLHISYREPFRAGLWTTCCGGTVKLVYPKLAAKLSNQRIKELSESNLCKAIVSCPYCLASLSSSAVNSNLIIVDLIELIYEVYHV